MLELGGGKARNLFELAGEMGQTAIMHFKGDLGKGKSFIKQEHLYAFDLMTDIEFFDGRIQSLREQIGHISVIMVEPCA